MVVTLQNVMIKPRPAERVFPRALSHLIMKSSNRKKSIHDAVYQTIRMFSFVGDDEPGGLDREVLKDIFLINLSYSTLVFYQNLHLAFYGVAYVIVVTSFVRASG